MQLTHKYIISGIIFLILAVILSELSAQTVENKCDTLYIEAPAFLVLSDTTIHVDHDSSAIICNKYILISKKRGYQLYSKIVGEAEKSGIVNSLFQSLIVSSTQDTMLIKNNIIEAEDAYKPYEGRIIRNIDIKVLVPFGPSLSDTNLPVTTNWATAINKSHIKTNKGIIKNKLMFEENDQVDPYELVENTNELAKLSYLQDATIIVNDADGDSVDVLVLVKDKFPWLPGVNISSAEKMTVYLRNVNMFGLGQSLQVGVTMDTKSSPFIYISDINYYINNLFNQVSAAINYNIGDYEQKYQLILNRNIIPLSVRMGGGLELTLQEENIIIDPTYIDQSRWYFKYRYMELWSSYLFYDKTRKDKQDKNHLFFLPGIGVYNKLYLDRPFVSADSNSMFMNYTNLLGNLALAQQNYIRTNFLMSFGKAEYIPYGFQATLTGGYTWSEYFTLPYLGFGFASTIHFQDFGYLTGNIQLGSHFSSMLSQGAFNLDFNYLSSIVRHKKYRYRFLTSVKYTTGINRITNDLLYLGEDYGFVGIKDETFYGQERLFFELTGMSYTPWYFLGFRFAAFGFFSAGLLGYEDHSIFNNRLLTSFGIGLYTQNDFLAFNSLQVRLAYFPVTPNGISNFGISFSTLGLLDQINFLNTKPQTVSYN